MKNKKILGAVLGLMLLFSACTSDGEQANSSELLKGQLVKNKPISETVKAPEITITSTKIDLFKEKSNAILNQFYYGEQVPVFRFTAKSSTPEIDTYIKKLVFKVDVKGNIETNNYTLYDLDNPQKAITGISDPTRINLIIFKDITDIVIPKNLVTEKTFELRAKVTKKEGDLKEEPKITVTLESSEASGSN